MRPKLLALFLVSVALGSIADAQPQPDAQQTEVRDLFEEGQQLFEQGNFQAAADKFRQAYDLKPASAFIFNEAVCYERLNDKSKASTLFRRYLEATPQARDRDAIERRIARLDTSAAPAPTSQPAPKPQAAAELQGVVFIETKPQVATVYLDNRSSPPLGQTPWNGAVSGKHTFIFVAPGFRDEQQTVDVKPGAYTHLFVAMAQAEYLGWIEVRANIPGADVYLDGEESGAIGQTPYMGNVTPGKHSLLVTRTGYTEDRRELNIVAGEAQRIEVSLTQAPIGFIDVNGPDLEGASVSVDGKRVCQHVPCHIRTTSGVHRVSVWRSGRKPYTRSIAVERASRSDLSVKLAPRASHADGYWKLGGALLLAGGGVALTMRANSLADQLKTEPSDDKDREQKLMRYGGIGLMAAGGILAVVGVVSLLSDKGPSSVGTVESRELGASFAPVVAPGYQGIAAVLRF